MSSKWCIEVEDRLLAYFGKKFGYLREDVHGNFSSGATEANYTALLCALCYHLPTIAKNGVLGLTARPVVYCTEETHHSIARAVRVCGLGNQSLRLVPVNKNNALDVHRLEDAIKSDRARGYQPLFVVGTLGSTSAGVIDALDEIAVVAKNYGLWFHVDAAWGGAIALLPEYTSLFAGLSSADSISFDPHKWLSIPMGCGMFITRHKGILRKTFDVEESFYMPQEARSAPTTEPYRQSMQWSRRFMGLKLFMTLAVHSEQGYCQVLRHQITMGHALRSLLVQNNWRIENETPLPVVCFTDANGSDPEAIRQTIIASGRAFVTTTKLSLNHARVVRAGIPSFLTCESHLHELVSMLNQARTSIFSETARM